MLTNPAIPVARKRGVVERAARPGGSLQPAVAKLLLMLAERDRLAILPDVATPSTPGSWTIRTWSGPRS